MLKYDDACPISIENYSKELIGMTFNDVLNNAEINSEKLEEIQTIYGNPRHKGGLGNLLEKYYFEYEINNSQEPDFPKAGVELKTTPYELRKLGKQVAGERVSVTMISYDKPVEEDFDTSHVFAKLRLTQFIYYLRNKELQNKLDYRIDYAALFSPPEEDLELIRQDYQKIIDKVKSGKAHELSEGDTNYLGACTKGSTAEKSKVAQFYAPEIKASKRAFCLKNSYMTYVLNEYIRKDVKTHERILSDSDKLKEKSFEEIITSKINKFCGKSDESLCEVFGMPYKGNKAVWSNLSFRMLGVKSNRAEEFDKANIEVKTIRLESNGKMKESISFPSVVMKEIVETDWEDSELFSDLSSKRYLFVVFKKQDENYVLQGCQFWNMPYSDLETKVQSGWEAVKKVVNEGVVFNKKETANGIEIQNNLPKKSENEVIHMRPHASKRFYKFGDGEIIGDNPVNGDELPDGRQMTKQCFWLNNSYILGQIDDFLK